MLENTVLNHRKGVEENKCAESPAKPFTGDLAANFIELPLGFNETEAQIRCLARDPGLRNSGCFPNRICILLKWV